MYMVVYDTLDDYEHPRTPYQLVSGKPAVAAVRCFLNGWRDLHTLASRRIRWSVGVTDSCKRNGLVSLVPSGRGAALTTAYLSLLIAGERFGGWGCKNLRDSN